MSMLDEHIAEIDQKLANLRCLRHSMLSARRTASNARHSGQDTTMVIADRTTRSSRVHRA